MKGLVIGPKKYEPILIFLTGYPFSSSNVYILMLENHVAYEDTPR